MNDQAPSSTMPETGSQPEPPKPKNLFSTAMSPATVLLAGGAAVSLNLASHSGSWASIGGFTTVVIMAVMIIYTRRRSGTLTPTSLTAAILAVTLGINIVLRSALVVTIPTWFAITALLCSAAADLSAKSATGKILSTIDYIGDLFLLPAWIAYSLRPREGQSSRNIQWLSLIRGILLMFVVTAVVVALLVSGDQVFASFLPSVGLSFSHILLTGLFFPFAAAFALTSLRTKPLINGFDQADDEPKPPRSFPIELLVVLGGLAAVLTAWSATTVAVILDGNQVIARTPDLTHADYAREGFFQLVAVAAIVTLAIAATTRFVNGPDDARQRRGKILVAVLTIETAALAVTALSKMSLYINSYGLTSTRLSVAWFLVWVLGALVVSSKRVMTQKRLGDTFGFDVPNLIPGLQALSFLMLLLFGLSNPDHMVASFNLDRDVSAVDLDSRYLLRLSSDATPVVLENSDQLEVDLDSLDWFEQAIQLEDYCQEHVDQWDKAGLFGRNYSKARANRAATTYCI